MSYCIRQKCVALTAVTIPLRGVAYSDVTPSIKEAHPGRKHGGFVVRKLIIIIT
jgi:hypothetical protein